VTCNGLEVGLVNISDIGGGWLEVRMWVDGKRYGWFEHKSRRDNYKSEDEWVAYLADQAVGLAEANALPLN
jgi:hypothetical protein